MARVRVAARASAAALSSSCFQISCTSVSTSPSSRLSLRACFPGLPPPPRETVADAGGTDALHLYPRALVTYQCHDRIQAHRQAEFFQLAAQYGLTATRLMTVEAPVQFDESDGDDEEEGIKADDIAAEEDVTRQVQLWELACSI